jgi:uncharacterized protein (DUF2147 family)
MNPIQIRIYFIAFILILTPCIYAQSGNEILGEWLPSKGNAHIKISRYGDYFSGRITWLKDPIDDKTGKPQLDKNNPDSKMHKVPLLGYLIMQGFKFNGNEWSGGTIYDPENGKLYSCRVKLKDKNTLDVRGFIGISLIGRSDTWTRVK